MEAKKGLRKKILLVVLLVACLVAVRASGIGGYLNVESLKAHKVAIHSYVNPHPVLSPLLYILVYIVAVALSIPGATVLTLAGGFLFGTIKTAICVNIGATAGSALVFLITRYLLGDWLQRRYRTQLERFNKEIADHGLNYLLTVRFIPVLPFFLINILAGLTRVRLGTFIWTTSVGILPGDLVYSYAGSQIDTIASTRDILSPNILVALILLALLSISPIIIGYVRRGVRKRGM